LAVIPAKCLVFHQTIDDQFHLIDSDGNHLLDWDKTSLLHTRAIDRISPIWVFDSN
jgi:hypothetical protein